MRIKQITFRHRRDFRAVLECEHCGSKQTLEGGYDDAHYHEHVLPSIRCVSCRQPRPVHADPAAVDFAQRRAERFALGAP